MIKDEPAFMQAKITAQRLTAAQQALKLDDQPSESELVWLISVAEGVLNLAIHRAMQLAQYWRAQEIHKNNKE